MARMFIVLRKRNSKRFLGAIPIRRGASLTKIQKLMLPTLRRKFAVMVVNSKKLKAIILRQRPRLKRRR